ncbi:MAG: dockerin type I repeat-containing protein, partial [Candidatus Micrarchaeota archaeon]
SLGNRWNLSTTGNYWSDFGNNPGYPYTYEISGPGNGVDYHPVGSASPYVCGDADGSGQIDISDAVFLVEYIFDNGTAPNPLASGDANGDETVNISDAVYLINYIFSGGPAPVCGNNSVVTDMFTNGITEKDIENMISQSQKRPANQAQ